MHKRSLRVDALFRSFRFFASSTRLRSCHPFRQVVTSLPRPKLFSSLFFVFIQFGVRFHSIRLISFFFIRRFFRIHPFRFNCILLFFRLDDRQFRDHFPTALSIPPPDLVCVFGRPESVSDCGYIFTRFASSCTLNPSSLFRNGCYFVAKLCSVNKVIRFVRPLFPPSFVFDFSKRHFFFFLFCLAQTCHVFPMPTTRPPWPPSV